MRLQRILAVAVAALCLTGCARAASTFTGNVSAPAVELPTQVLGLTVEQESIDAEVQRVERPYLDAVAMFSLREDGLLRATLQLGRLNAVARPGDPSFRRSIVGQMGGATPMELIVDGNTVFATATTRQNVFVWFSGRGMYVLNVHEDFEFPRTLLRRILQMEMRL